MQPLKRPKLIKLSLEYTNIRALWCKPRHARCDYPCGQPHRGNLFRSGVKSCLIYKHDLLKKNMEKRELLLLCGGINGKLSLPNAYLSLSLLFSISILRYDSNCYFTTNSCSRNNAINTGVLYNDTRSSSETRAVITVNYASGIMMFEKNRLYREPGKVKLSLNFIWYREEWNV